MPHIWQELTRLTGGQAFDIERIRLRATGIAIEGSFELPPIAQLASDDLVFVAAFVRSHGSIKQMEKLFGVSYPTIKNRLNKIAGQLEFVEIEPVAARADILERVDRGELSVEQALEMMQKGESDE